MSEPVSEPASPFTIERLAALFNAEGIAYDRAEDEPVIYLHQGCDHVPHELRLTVYPQAGSCAIYQHDVCLFAPAMADPVRLGEACRLALLLNGAMLFGSFMLHRFGGNGLSFGTMIPTAGAELSLGQIMQAVSCVCAEVDRCYPLLQAVLWGGLSADEALARYHASFEPGDGSGGDGGGPDDGGPAGPNGGLDSEASVLDAATIDRIDTAFLDQHDPADPFSAAAADAIRSRRVCGYEPIRPEDVE